MSKVKFTPDNATKPLISLFETYEAQIESKILHFINKALYDPKKYITEEVLRARRSEVKSILNKLKKGANDWTSEFIPIVYIGGQKEALGQLDMDINYGSGILHEQTIRALSEEINSRFEDVVQTIARKANDIFREVQLDAVVSSVMGTENVKQSAKRIMDQVKKNGLTGFVDAAGRRWNMANYAEMASRTVAMNAHRKGVENELREHGIDLVIISSHPLTCPKCAKFQGEILSLSGNTPGYRSMAYAREQGLFHPRCRHSFYMYVSPDE